MKKFLFCVSACVAAALFTPSLQAQSKMSGGPSPTMNAALTKLFGTHKAFTADTEVSTGSPDKPTLYLVVKSAFLDGKVRSEVDMSAAKGVELPPQAAAQMKQMGMDTVVSILRPDQKTMLLVYPNMKSYVEMKLSPEEAAAFEKEPKIETTQLGKETVEGHPCVKNKVVVTDEKGEKQEITVWNATDLKEFPIKMQTTADGAQVTMVYKNVQFTRPDAKLFDAPAGYEKFTDQSQLMQKVMQRMFGGAGAPGKN